MLSIFNRKQLYNNNKNIMNYCRTSTENSIRRLVEREKPMFNKYLNKYDLSVSLETVSMYKNSFTFFTLLSISSFMYLFLHRKR